MHGPFKERDKASQWRDCLEISLYYKKKRNDLPCTSCARKLSPTTLRANLSLHAWCVNVGGPHYSRPSCVSHYLRVCCAYLFHLLGLSVIPSVSPSPPIFQFSSIINFTCLANSPGLVDNGDIVGFVGTMLECQACMQLPFFHGFQDHSAGGGTCQISHDTCTPFRYALFCCSHATVFKSGMSFNRVWSSGSIHWHWDRCKIAPLPIK